MRIELKPNIMRGKQPAIDIAVFKGKGFVAGGSIRRWFSGEEQNSDIDIFAISESDHTNIKNELSKECEPIDTGNALTYGRKQLINFRFADIDELFAWFDYAHCQFAWDGEKIYTTENAIIATLRKHLMVNNIHSEYAVDSLRRAFKYQKSGFEPCWGTLRDIALSLGTTSIADINRQVKISPKGGKRLVYFD